MRKYVEVTSDLLKALREARHIAVRWNGMDGKDGNGELVISNIMPGDKKVLTAYENPTKSKEIG